MGQNLRLYEDARTTHMHVLGISGQGKSYFLEQTILSAEEKRKVVEICEGIKGFKQVPFEERVALQSKLAAQDDLIKMKSEVATLRKVIQKFEAIDNRITDENNHLSEMLKVHKAEVKRKEDKVMEKTLCLQKANTRIKYLEAQCDDSRRVVSDLKDKLTSMNATNQELLQQVNEFKSEKQAMMSDKLSLQQQITGLSNDVKRYQNSIAELNDKIQSLERANSSLEVLSSGVTECAASLESACAVDDASHDSLKEVSEKVSSLIAMIPTLTHDTSLHRSIQQDFRNLEVYIKNIEAELRESTSSRDSLVGELGGVQQEKKSAMRENESLKQDNQLLTQEIAELKDQLNDKFSVSDETSSFHTGEESMPETPRDERRPSNKYKSTELLSPPRNDRQNSSKLKSAHDKVKAWQYNVLPMETQEKHCYKPTRPVPTPRSRLCRTQSASMLVQRPRYEPNNLPKLTLTSEDNVTSRVRLPITIELEPEISVLHTDRSYRRKSWLPGVGEPQDCLSRSYSKRGKQLN